MEGSEDGESEMRTVIPFVGPRSKNEIVQVNSQETLNLYPSIDAARGKHSVSLKVTPGLTLVANHGFGSCRSNGEKFSDKLYFVLGNLLASVDSNGGTSSVGTLNTSVGRCSVARGRDYVMAVDGGDGYTYDGTTFATISDADFPASPEQCAYLDGYFIVNDADTDRFYISSLEDPTSWAALDFETAASDPDDVVGITTTHRDLYAFGSETIQVYYNSGNADFPFTVYPQGVLEWGLHAPFSVAKSQGRIFFLAQTNEGSVFFVMLNGFQGAVISDENLSREIAAFPKYDDAYGYCYQDRGQTFYVVTFPLGDRTFVYSLETGMWHRRQTGTSAGRYAAGGHGYLSNTHFIGDGAGSKMYRLDHSKFTDDGTTIIRQRTSEVFHVERRRLQINQLELEFEPGVGLTSGQGNDPQAMLRYSRDGGKTWSNEIWRAIGKKGAYRDRTIWNQLGVGREFVFEVSVSDPVKANILGGYIDMDVLAA